jgi:hypothetical protein
VQLTEQYATFEKKQGYFIPIVPVSYCCVTKITSSQWHTVSISFSGELVGSRVPLGLTSVPLTAQQLGFTWKQLKPLKPLAQHWHMVTSYSISLSMAHGQPRVKGLSPFEKGTKKLHGRKYS